MKDKSYFLEVGSKGEERLNSLNKVCNTATQKFISKMPISPSAKILEIGCGTGEMSIWLAKNVVPSGKVTATDASEEQITITKQLAIREGVKNIEFRTVSAYDINNLGLECQFDVIFGRFILIHLINQIDVLNELKNLLANKGLLIIEDGILSNSFIIYPENNTFNKLQDFVIKLYHLYNKDPDTGKKLISFYRDMGLQIVDYEYNNSLLKTEEERSIILQGIYEIKDKLLDNFLDNKALEEFITKIRKILQDQFTIINGTSSIIVAGRKLN